MGCVEVRCSFLCGGLWMVSRMEGAATGLQRLSWDQCLEELSKLSEYKENINITLSISSQKEHKPRPHCAWVELCCPFHQRWSIWHHSVQMVYWWKELIGQPTQLHDHYCTLSRWQYSLEKINKIRYIKVNAPILRHPRPSNTVQVFKWQQKRKSKTSTYAFQGNTHYRTEFSTYSSLQIYFKDVNALKINTLIDLCPMQN